MTKALNSKKLFCFTIMVALFKKYFLPGKGLKKVSLYFFLILFLSYAGIHINGGYNHNSRLDLVHSVVIKGTLSIDDYHDNTGDKSLFNDHYYSDKAPGVAFVAIPSFFVIKHIFSWFEINVDDSKGWFISSWFTTIFSVGFITALGGVFIFLLLKEQHNNTKAALVCSGAVFLSSVIFTYASTLFSHAMTAGFIAISLWSCFSKKQVSYKCYLGGFCAGMAVICEYTSALVIISIFLVVAFRSYRQALMFCVGGIFPILLFVFYNYFGFGSFISTGYANVDGWEQMETGLFGINFRYFSGEKFYKLLFSRYRGMFFWTPFLLMFLPGIIFFWKKNWKMLLGIIMLFLLQVFLIASYFAWDGGNSVGPRHLAALYPIMLIPAYYGYLRFPRIGNILAVISILISVSSTLVTHGICPGIGKPVLDFILPEIFLSEGEPNIFRYFGLPLRYSVIIYYLLVIILLGFLVKACKNNQS